MSNQQSYLDEQWNDLPLPDGDKAWEQMAILLDKEEERKRILPPWFSCWFVTGFGLLLLAGGLWYWLQQKGGENKPVHSSLSKKEETVSYKNVSPSEKKNTVSIDETRPLPNLSQNDSITLTEGKKSSRAILVAQTKTDTVKNSLLVYKRHQNKRKEATQSTAFKQSKLIDGKSPSKFTATDQTARDVTSIETTMIVLQNISAPVVRNIAAPKIVSATDSDGRAKNAEDSSEKKKVAKDGKLHWSVGIGLQQAILLSSQESSAFNYNGKSAVLSDHIPSLIVGLQKDRWLAQVALQPNLPQPVKRFSLDQNTVYDSSTQTLTTDRLRLQKLYYHQASLTIGYALTNKWSVAVGGTVNFLAGAVLETEHEQRFLPTGGSTLTKSRQTIKGGRDSLLKGTTAGLSVEAAYQWKRLSLGLRYTQDVMTYFNHSFFDEKNKLLQASLRFQLWKN